MQPSPEKESSDRLTMPMISGRSASGEAAAVEVLGHEKESRKTGGGGLRLFRM
jgi:hypothetical protein